MHSEPGYKAILISQYNTIKAPNPTALANAEALPANAGLTPAQVWASLSSFGTGSLSTGIKGDPTGDVAAFITNIVNSENFAVGTASTGSLTNANNPADGLFANGFLVPQLLG